MASEKAKIAKDEASCPFKSGDYPAAIGHYTSAILADAKDPTFALNRAAAYLKLGKNEDAERDCTTVLKLSPNNVKALFRRGQARTGLGSLDGARAGENEEILRPAPVITSPPATVDATVHKAPTTLFNFTKMWESNMKDEDRWNLFSGIPPLSLPKMFQASLDPALLSSMLQHFERVIDQQIAVPSDVREYMVSLSRVQRFGTIMLFMSKDEKILLNRLWEKCGKLDS
ncbi:TPR-like protein [Rhizopogon vinicolor AM-OR11-026]|uniref:RNA polymerase II-associated protein 3 n=1 Tax=Rhizopogon vinicolor AM-OR11-026 TaxID=1314800 RepID=A0A1B7N4Z8_9AGAM|nr:TPR-like protein [Rhizopogon vinicolor AM-OR11-026]